MYESSNCPGSLSVLTIFFYWSHLNRHTVVPHYGFTWHFPNDQCLSMCSLAIHIASWVSQIFWHFITFIFLTGLHVWEFFMYFRYKSCVGGIVCQYFLPVCSLSFHSLFIRIKVLKFDEVHLINFLFCEIMLFGFLIF